MSGVAEAQLETLIVIGAIRQAGQMPLAELDDLRIELGFDDPPDGLVLDHLAQRAAVAAADDAHTARPAVRDDRCVRQHLVIGPLVGRRRLHHAVQSQHRAPLIVLEHDQILMLGPLVEQHPVHLETLLPCGVQGLGKPFQRFGLRRLAHVNGRPGQRSA